MKRKSVKRKIIKWLSAVLIVLAILSMGITFIGKRMMDKYSISFDSLRYSFPNSIRVKELKFNPDSTVDLQFGSIDLSLSWFSLLKMSPRIFNLDVKNATILIFSDGSTDTSDIEVPKFSLSDVNMNNIHFEYLSYQDTLFVELESLFLSSAEKDIDILVDSIFLSGTQVSYSYSSNGVEQRDSTDFAFSDIPGFEVNNLVLDECAFLVDDSKNSQSLSNLDLKFTGWKSRELFDFNIERLSLTYQDTLDMDIIMDNGKLNKDLLVDLHDVSIHVPGLNLNIAEINAQTSKQLQLKIGINNSNISFGRITQLYPDINSVIDPLLPADSLIHFSGNLSFAGESLFFESLNIQFFDSTFVEVNGTIDWSTDITELNLDLFPIRTTNTNLYALLSEESYNEFFSWPTDIRGKAKITSTPADVDISGSLQTREGNLSVKSIISTDVKSDFIFSLALKGDSLLLDQFVTIIPDSIPYGDVDFFLSYSGEEKKRNDELVIDIYSKQLFAYGKLLKDIDFKYTSNHVGDSIKANVNDDSLKVKLTMFHPAGENDDYYFEGDIRDINPNSYLEPLPEGIFSTSFKGSFNVGTNEYGLEMNLNETKLQAQNQGLFFPDSELSIASNNGVINLLLQSENQTIFKGKTGTKFPEFRMPVNEWLDDWPETEIEARVNLDEKAFYLLTGREGILNMEALSISNRGKKWNAVARLPSLSYAGSDVHNLKIDIKGDSVVLDAELTADSLGNSSVQFDDLNFNLDYSEGQYSLNFSNFYSETQGLNKISLILNDLDEGYNLKFNEKKELIIDNVQVEITRNHGLDFSDSLQLIYGDLALRMGSTHLEANTSGEDVKLRLDSLKITSIIEYFTGMNYLEADVNGVVNINQRTSEADWNGDILAKGFDNKIVTQITFEGRSFDEELYSDFNFEHEDLSADISIYKRSEILNYISKLDNFDLKFLELIPGLPEGLEMEGTITGRVTGEIGEKITADGYLIPENVALNLPLVYTPLSINRDTLYLEENHLILNNFMIQDVENNNLVLNGTAEYFPEPGFNFQIQSKKFRLLDNHENKALVNGVVDATADLAVKGTLKNINIDGFIKTFPGARVKYTTRESFDLIDASQIVTFIDFTNDSVDNLNTFQETYTEISWNVGLEIAESRIEILLDEINQEYINLTGSGYLNLKNGRGPQPLVYGSIRSNSGTAYIIPPAIQDLDLIIENANIVWNGFLDEPDISFEGYKEVKASPRGLGREFSQSTHVENFMVKVILDHASLSQLDVTFDLEGESTTVNNYIQSLPLDTRQTYAINLLVFGRIGSEQVSGNSYAVDKVTKKLNEIARRNLKNSDISFIANSYKEGRTDGRDQLRTDLNYSINKGFLDNRLSFSVGGSVGVYMDNMTELPPANLLGNIEIDYRLREKPSLLLKGMRKDVYHGIIDGNITETSLGLYYQRNWPKFDDFFKIEKKLEAENPDSEQE